MTGPLQCFLNNIARHCKVAVTNPQGTAGSWATLRAERSQEVRAIPPQAEAASPNMTRPHRVWKGRAGRGTASPERPRQGKVLVPLGRPTSSSRRQGQRQDQRAGYEINPTSLVKTEPERRLGTSCPQNRSKAHPGKPFSKSRQQGAQLGHVPVVYTSDKARLSWTNAQTTEGTWVGGILRQAARATKA